MFLVGDRSPTSQRLIADQSATSRQSIGATSHVFSKNENVKVGNDQETAQSERNSHS